VCIVCVVYNCLFYRRERLGETEEQASNPHYLRGELPVKKVCRPTATDLVELKFMYMLYHLISANQNIYFCIPIYIYVCTFCLHLLCSTLNI